MPQVIDRDGVQSWMRAGAQLIDVLPAKEYRKVHLAQAINIPLQDLDRVAGRTLERDRPVVVYCYDYQ